MTKFSFFKKYYVGNRSDHFDGTSFFDHEFDEPKTFFDVLKWQVSKKSVPWPKKVRLEKTDVPPERVYGNALRISNVGHATFLIQTEGVNLLTDPVWSERASPSSFFGPKRVIDPGICFDDLPPIDIVWISHNHYDHLDLSTVGRLWEHHNPRFIAPLGNDKIIQFFYNKISVDVMDWGNQIEISKNFKLHLTPSQHWSARGIFDRNCALWGALTIEASGGNIYFVGDSGYGDGRYFKQDKATFGSYRAAILPMGAYEPRWFMKYAHMNPDDMVKAHDDLGKPYTIPSHYDVFKLTDEGRGEAKIALENAILEKGKREKIQILDVGHFIDVPNS